MVPGWRGRIGIICPDDGVNDDEFWLYLPEGVTLLFTRWRPKIPDRPIRPDMVAAYMDPALLEAAAQTLRITRPASVVMPCNSCSFIGGPDSVAKIEEVIARGAQSVATTTTTAQLAALKALGVHSVAVGAPYVLSVTERLCEVLEANGFKVENVVSLGLDSEWQIGNSDEGVWYRLAAEANTASSEAVVLACGGIRTARIMDAMEADLDRPVVSAPAASIWHALRLAGIADRVPHRGVLFREF